MLSPSSGSVYSEVGGHSGTSVTVYQSLQDNVSEDLDSGFYFVTAFFKSFCKKYIAYILLCYFSAIWPITPQCLPCCTPFTVCNNSISFLIECIVYMDRKDITKVT